MIWIGIDPGQKGALAIIGWDAALAEYDATARLEDGPLIIPFDQDRYIGALLAVETSGVECVCCIEDVHSLPREGVVAAHNFGRSIGWLHGILDAIGIPYQPITPQKWKKEFGLNSDKANSIEVCKRLYPGVNLLRTERSRKEDDNMAEALLLSTYAKRKF